MQTEAIPKHCYGPVPSRRLGRSLGVSPIPFKACTYDCVYCQLGRTAPLTDRRRRFYPATEVLQEIRRSLELHAGAIDYVTFVGEGEPCLYEGLGDLIAETKAATDVPVAVVTNGSLLCREDVRRELAGADTVMPSMDGADAETWKAVNRPHRRLRLSEVIDGLVEFRRQLRGQLWVEVMLVGGLNDSEDSLLAIRHALERVAPDQVHVNVPIRPPAESWVTPPDANGLTRAHAILQEGVFYEERETGDFSADGFERPLDAVTAIVRRHPMRREQIVSTLSAYSADRVEEALHQLLASDQVHRVTYAGHDYYVTGEARRG